MAKAKLYHNGKLKWVIPATYKSSCTFDVTYFPFDGINSIDILKKKSA
jgi:nicotinic acetylcholine receptor alpha-2